MNDNHDMPLQARHLGAVVRVTVGAEVGAPASVWSVSATVHYTTLLNTARLEDTGTTMVPTVHIYLMLCKAKYVLLVIFNHILFVY